MLQKKTHAQPTCSMQTTKWIAQTELIYEAQGKLIQLNIIRFSHIHNSIDAHKFLNQFKFITSQLSYFVSKSSEFN